jgi:CO/xanthine dehydrogenase Mo-binding subunit
MIPKSIIGAGIDRVDGPLKVTGGALYAGDTQLAGMVYAVPVLSTIARGNIVSMDIAAASIAPGVLAVITRENAPPLLRAVTIIQRRTSPVKTGCRFRTTRSITTVRSSVWSSPIRWNAPWAPPNW